MNRVWAFVACGLFSCSLLSLTACANRADTGLVAGGIVGGAAGSALTGGSTVGTVAGAVGGAFIGRDIATRN